MVESETIFYFFSSVILISAIFVVISRNPVHSVLWLILTFFGSSGLFILLGAEFLALILMIVYIVYLLYYYIFVLILNQLYLYLF